MKRLALLLLLTGSMAAAACSSSSTSSTNASQEVCNDRAAFSSSVQQVGNDVRSLNLGQAKDDASKAVDAFNALVDSVKKLTSEQRSSLSPQIDSIQSDVSAFSDISNVNELSSALNTTGSNAQSAIDAIKSDLNCG